MESDWLHNRQRVFGYTRTAPNACWCCSKEASWSSFHSSSPLFLSSGNKIAKFELKLANDSWSPIEDFADSVSSPGFHFFPRVAKLYRLSVQSRSTSGTMQRLENINFCRWSKFLLVIKIDRIVKLIFIHLQNLSTRFCLFYKVLTKWLPASRFFHHLSRHDSVRGSVSLSQTVSENNFSLS